MFNSRDIIQKTDFGQNLTFQSAPVMLKINPTPPPNNVYMRVWSKLINWLRR